MLTTFPSSKGLPVVALGAMLLAACGGGSAAPSASSAGAAPASVAQAAKPAASAGTSTAPASAKPAASAGAASAAANPAASGAASLDALAAAAKADGKLTLGFSANPPLQQQVLPAFQSQFGIQVEQVVASAADLANKVAQEKAAGQTSVDALIGGCGAFPAAYSLGIFAPLKPQLVLPDATDASKWIGGKT